MNLVDQAKELWGEGTVEAFLGDVGLHSTSTVPTTDNEKFAFALLEAIDWECPKYDWVCRSVPQAYGEIGEEDMQLLLIGHRDEVMTMEIEPTSYIGLFAGSFEFLADQPEGT